MIIKNLNEYKKKCKNEESVILDYLKETLFKLMNVDIIPEFIICDAQHKELFKNEIRFYSTSPYITEVSDSFTVIGVNGYKMKVLTRIETGEDAFEGIELYGRIKDK